MFDCHTDDSESSNFIDETWEFYLNYCLRNARGKPLSKSNFVLKKGENHPCHVKQGLTRGSTNNWT